MKVTMRYKEKMRYRIASPIEFTYIRVIRIERQREKRRMRDIGRERRRDRDREKEGWG